MVSTVDQASPHAVLVVQENTVLQQKTSATRAQRVNTKIVRGQVPANNVQQVALVQKQGTQKQHNVALVVKADMAQQQGQQQGDNALRAVKEDTIRILDQTKQVRV